MNKSILSRICLVCITAISIFHCGNVYAEVTKPEVKTRAEWGADESLVTEEPEYKNVTHLVVHHTSDGNAVQGKTDEERVQNIYKYHVGKFGDMGYNALIGSDGTIYEGKRGKGGNEILQDGVVGAHAFGFNRHTFSVGLIGNFNNQPMPDEMRNSLIHLLAFEAQTWNIDPTANIDFVRSYYDTLSDVQKKQVPKIDLQVSTIQGHGQLPRACTDCPGTHVKKDLDQIRKDVEKLLKQ